MGEISPFRESLVAPISHTPLHLLQEPDAAAKLGPLPCSNASHTFHTSHTSNTPYTFCRNMTRLPSWDFLSCALISSRLVSMGRIYEWEWGGREGKEVSVNEGGGGEEGKGRVRGRGCLNDILAVARRLCVGGG